MWHSEPMNSIGRARHRDVERPREAGPAPRGPVLAPAQLIDEIAVAPVPVDEIVFRDDRGVPACGVAPCQPRMDDVASGGIQSLKDVSAAGDPEAVDLPGPQARHRPAPEVAAPHEILFDNLVAVLPVRAVLDEHPDAARVRRPDPEEPAPVIQAPMRSLISMRLQSQPRDIAVLRCVQKIPQQAVWSGQDLPSGRVQRFGGAGVRGGLGMRRPGRSLADGRSGRSVIFRRISRSSSVSSRRRARICSSAVRLFKVVSSIDTK
jgi:hypothetical protein